MLTGVDQSSQNLGAPGTQVGALVGVGQNFFRGPRPNAPKLILGAPGPDLASSPIREPCLPPVTYPCFFSSCCWCSPSLLSLVLVFSLLVVVGVLFSLLVVGVLFSLVVGVLGVLVALFLLFLSLAYLALSSCCSCPWRTCRSLLVVLVLGVLVVLFLLLLSLAYLALSSCCSCSSY